MGGTSQVWEVSGRKEPAIVKLYDQPDRHEEHVKELLPRLMRAYGGEAELTIARPSATISRDGQFLGVGSSYFRSPWVSLDRALHHNEWTLSSRVSIATKLAMAVDIAHTHAFVIGDLNPPNVLVNLKARSAVLIDVDSWGWEPPWSLAEILVPGLSRPQDVSPLVTRLNKDGYVMPGNVRSSQGTDRFALTVMVCYVLTQHHPFGSAPLDRRELKTPQDRIRENRSWVLEPAKYNLPKQLFAGGHPGLATFPGELRELLGRALGEQEYPHAIRWADALRAATVTSCKSCGTACFGDAACSRCFGLSTSPVVPGTLAGQTDDAFARLVAALSSQRVSAVPPSAPPFDPVSSPPSSRDRSGLRPAGLVAVVALVLVALLVIGILVRR